MSDKKAAYPLPYVAPTAYTPARRWLDVGCDETGPFPGLAATIAALSRDESDPLTAVQTYDDLAVLVAPWVRAWNVALPPPAEAGPTVFHGLDKGILVWLRQLLIQAPLLIEVAPVADESAALPGGKVVA